ncbi:hypothetical protein BJY21_000897 [Kineosphaera limosa]|uniref:Uncharacterized protein n=1 Tax=Kineosphaera limosa NBRC 100340 TaxID=1184609 RepID=K6WWX1_9MICO|nr:hypothetical protein [Kineosphaera limosa]NYD99712.1 hypothetical protein [Kineosphaera limosa]GAB98286.1 hypothetical protein KILIM_122_00030 [Kineosphaera limosa NBRC 100340]
MVTATPQNAGFPATSMAALRAASAPVLEVIDSTRTACVIVLAEYLDLLDPPQLGEDALLTLVTTAFESQAVPVGPLAYTLANVEFEVSADARTAWAFTQRAPRVRDLMGVLRLEPQRLVVGGTRYGWIPGVGCEPTHVLLADMEAVIAEARVYTALRAAHIGYAGQVRITAMIYNDVPFEPLALRRFDEYTGELFLEMASLRAFPPKSTVYSLTSTPDEIRRIYFALARRIAAAFGAAKPQFLADPDSRIVDDTTQVVAS